MSLFLSFDHKNLDLWTYFTTAAQTNTDCNIYWKWTAIVEKHTEMSNKSVKCSWHGDKWGIRFTNQIKASIWTVPKKHVIAVRMELILLTCENNSHVTKVAVPNVNLSLFHVEYSQVEMPFSCGCHCPIRSISFHISISLPWQPDCNTASDENGCLPNLMLPPSPSSLVFLI